MSTRSSVDFVCSSPFSSSSPPWAIHSLSHGAHRLRPGDTHTDADTGRTCLYLHVSSRYVYRRRRVKISRTEITAVCIFPTAKERDVLLLFLQSSSSLFLSC